SVPTTASAKNAIGRMQAGCFKDRTNPGRSSVGATTMIQVTAKIATSEVDHGSASAISTATMSAVLTQVIGSRQTGSAAGAGDIEASTLMPSPPACPLARD